MIVIVDSGSTKSDWATIHVDGQVVRHTLVGINPATNIDLDAIELPESLKDIMSRVNKMYFYAAGLGIDATNDKLLKWIESYQFKGETILQSDIYGAIAATCGTAPGIVGILGTGSNSCTYDGYNIIDTIPSLGYILSDEGGGVDLGKKIISQYFYRLMPPNIKAKFELKYKITRPEVLHHLYSSSNGSKYLASFSEFLITIDDPWKDDLIAASFDNFIKLRILPYSNATDLPIHFVGSIAFYYQNYLAISLKKHNLHLGTIIKAPIENLINFHSQNK